MRAAFPRDPAPGSSGASRAPRVALAAAVLFLGLQWAWLAPVPFLSEDWTQLAALGDVETLSAALDPGREPLRPLQHAFLWLLAHCGADPAGSLPAVARAVALALFAGSTALVLGLARRAGLGAGGAAAAALLFVAFPCAKLLVWPAAIGSPLRVAFELAALLLLVRRAQGGPGWSGALGLVSLVLALGGHESAFLLPAILLAWLACVGTAGLREGLARVRAALRDPYVLAACALAAFHVVHLLWFRPQRVHGAKDLAALPANLAKAALALAPEVLRGPAIAGLRGHLGTLGLVLGGAALLAALALWILALWRGGLARFAALAIALDLGLAVAGAGFVQRYACLAAAFAALSVAEWASTPARRALAAALGLAWACDAWVDAREIRTAGAGALRLAAEARAVPGTAPLVLVGVPDMIGAEVDVPFFNWGGALFLRAHGCARPVRLVRERAFRTNSDQELVGPAQLAEFAAQGAVVLRWTGHDAPLVPYTP
ncbi:MAG: hypothetical protein JNK02_06245 [Planctomycetes bacterium]|nr:hypothetical protein [Planctomycetota bacterium]